MKNLFLTLICLFALSFPALAQIEGYVEENVNNDAYVVPADEAVRQKLDQWQDLKFGVLFHWGIYATTGVIESWSLVSQDIDWQYKARVAAGMDYDTYKKWYFSLKDVFNPIHFDPQQWADVMEDAGIRYMLFTTKHHDGFCMYDSKLTDFSITHGAFRNNPQSDVYKHVLDAFRDKNMMVGAYFSKPDWHCQWFWNPLFSTGQSMHQNYDISKHPDWWRNFCDFACGQIDEITGNYGPIDIVWLDGGLRCEAIGIDKAIEAARERTPGLICVDRSQHGPYENYRTPEREIPA
ncbi:MAG: alpha-L-fucosidase, partial [Bacteroidales bacterium]|nr:alpha-L-fucosidase [Bacteroidales bacterium]